jgi:hypothetical protein
MSPIRSSAAAGSSHAFGDNRFAKTVTEVTAQRKNGRYTTNIASPGTNVTLNQTPVAENLLVIMVSSQSALATATVTYGGTTATQITGNLVTGICGYLFYIPLTSANIASGGTTMNIVWSTAGTSAGYSVTEVSGVYAARPVDLGFSAFGGSLAALSSYYLTNVSATNHTYLGGYSLGFITSSGSTAWTLFGTGDMTGKGSWGTVAAANDVISFSFSNWATFTNGTSSIVPVIPGTTRNGVGIYVSFRPAA